MKKMLILAGLVVGMFGTMKAYKLGKSCTRMDGKKGIITFIMGRGVHCKVS